MPEEGAATTAATALVECHPCPHCPKIFTSRKALGGHLHIHTALRVPPIRVRRQTLIELLGAVAQWLEDGSENRDLPAAALARLREQDVKIRLAFHLLMLTRIDRINGLNSALLDVDAELKRRAEDLKGLGTLKTVEVTTLQARLEQSIAADLAMITAAVDKDSRGTATLAQRLETLLKELGADQEPLGGEEAVLPPSDREAIRRVLARLQGMQQDGHTGPGTRIALPPG